MSQCARVDPPAAVFRNPDHYKLTPVQRTAIGAALPKTAIDAARGAKALGVKTNVTIRYKDARGNPFEAQESISEAST